MVIIPAQPGSYIIIGTLSEEEQLISGPFLGQNLALGIYLYAGSVYGPGGLHARINRHLNPGTRKFWHFDHLKAIIHIKEIWYSLGETKLECQFIKGLQEIPHSGFPFRKFGASDCIQGCPAHLVRFPLPVNTRTNFYHLKNQGFLLRKLYLI